MKISRRSFLSGVSASAILCAAPSLSRTRGITITGTTSFNNGRTQGQPNFSYFGFALIDLIQQATGWNGSSASAQNVNSQISPSWLDANGFPLYSVFPTQTGSFGVNMNVTALPNANSYPANSSNPLVMVWEGANAASQVNIGNLAITLMPGYTNNVFSTFDAVSGLYKGRIEFYPTAYDANGNASFFASLVNMNSGATLTQFSCYFLNDEADFLAGKVFRQQFITLMKSLNWGVFRFMDWMFTNQSNVTTWSTRKSLSYPTYSQDEYRAALYPGDVMTNVGNDYSIAFGSGGPTDKQTMHLLFNANATLVQNVESAHGGTLSLTLPGGGSAVTFNWTSQPFSNGDPVSVNTGSVGGNPIQGFWPSQTFYVVNAATNSFQVSLTPGGSAAGSTSTSTGGNMGVTRLPTLNLNGSGAVPIKALTGGAIVSTSSMPARLSGSNRLYGTIVYDAQFQAWLLNGGGTGTNSGGIRNALPPELMVKLCGILGAKPHFSIPVMALDQPTDYVSNLALLVKNSGFSWMKSHWEPGNEIWNNLTIVTIYAYNKAFTYWGTTFDNINWMGMVLSTMGQSLASVFGIGNLGSTYEVMAGPNVDTFRSPVPGGSSTNDYFTSPNFVAGTPSIPGYLNAASSTYVSAVLPNTYVSPGMEGTLTQYQLAWEYFVSNVGNPTAQMANLNAYADSVNQGISGTGVFTIASPGVVNWPNHGRSLNDAIRTVTTGALPGGLAVATTYFVSNIVDADHFNVSTSRGGSSIAFTGTQSGTQFVSFGVGTNFYVNAGYINALAFAQANGVNKMFAYEGDWSLNPLSSTSGINSCYDSPITGSTNASQCVLTLATTTPPVTSNGSTYIGNPAIAGMILNIRNIGGMAQLCSPTSSDNLGSATITAGSPNIAWAYPAYNSGTSYGQNSFVQFSGVNYVSLINPNLGNEPDISPSAWLVVSGSPDVLTVGQGVMFDQANFMPPGLTAATPYYVVAATATNFQISTTKGGSAITFGGTGTYNVGPNSGWVVANVSGNSVTIDVNTTTFGTWTSGGLAYFIGSNLMITNFRSATLQNATDLPALLKANNDNFIAAGGLYPSKYGIIASAGGGAWGVVSTDIWQPLNQDGVMIAAYNH